MMSTQALTLYNICKCNILPGVVERRHWTMDVWFVSPFRPSLYPTVEDHFPETKHKRKESTL